MPQRFVALIHSLYRARFHIELLPEVVHGSLDPRVHLYLEVRVVFLAVHCKFQGVLAWKCPSTERIDGRVTEDRGNRKFMVQRFGRSIMQVPYKTMHPSLSGKNVGRANPVHRNGICGGDFFNGLSLVGAGIAPNEMVLLVENLERDGRA